MISSLIVNPRRVILSASGTDALGGYVRYLKRDAIKANIPVSTNKSKAKKTNSMV